MSHSSSSWRNFSYSYFFNYLYLPLEFLRIGTTELTTQTVKYNPKDDVLLALLGNGLLTLTVGLEIILLQYLLKVLGFFLLNAAQMLKASAQAYYDA
ncbi:MAG: hypothetical protein ACQZ3N_05300 [cyanobacterium endosymbiont of Rhopalodia yunnanensis]